MICLMSLCTFVFIFHWFNYAWKHERDNIAIHNLEERALLRQVCWCVGVPEYLRVLVNWMNVCFR